MDNACPRVKFVQRIVSDASKKGMDVILVGDKNHSQTNEIIGWIKTRVILIQNIESAMSIIPITAFSKKGVCMASTTEYSQEKYDEIAKYCHNVIPNLTVKDTICKEKENRENKIRQIIINCKADIIILGDPESINNMKSYKIAMKYCQHVFLIKSIGMLDTSILHDVEHVFVIVNHSVSEDVIKETFNILQSYCDKMKKEFVIEKLPHL